MPNDPWLFGWAQLLTLCGFAITVAIAVFGFRGFGRWQREKFEERRMDIAIEALALAHEAKYVFEAIRSPMAHQHEWQDMQKGDGESDEEYRGRQAFYVPLARIDRNKDFFERLFKLQPKFMALFGADKEQIFMHCHQARRTIEVSATMLMRTVNRGGEWNENRERQRDQWEADIWSGMDEVLENMPNAGRVSKGIRDFQQGILRICQPIAASRTGIFRKS